MTTPGEFFSRIECTSIRKDNRLDGGVRRTLAGRRRVKQGQGKRRKRIETIVQMECNRSRSQRVVTNFASIPKASAL